MKKEKEDNKNGDRPIKDLLKNINEYIDGKEILKNSTNLKIDEHDFYKGYSFLWGMRFIVNNTEINNVLKFNYKEYRNFATFLDSYENSNNLTKNKNKELNINYINKWINKLNDKKIKLMPKKFKNFKKKLKLIK